RTGIETRVPVPLGLAGREGDPAPRRACLPFVVVGGGPTGVELAGQIGELAHKTLRNQFHRFRPEDASVLLIEGADRILTAFPPPLSEKAVRSLAGLGVRVMCGAMVNEIDEAGVHVKHAGVDQRIEARTVIWAAGVQASSLGKKLSETAGATLDRAGRVMVQPDLTIAGHPEILVLGDLAHYPDAEGKPLPGVAPVAMQQGRYAADLI